MYEEFYKLSAKPFALNPDPTFYYDSKEHSRVLAYLRYGISQGEGFIVVSGDVGAGKTTLIAALLGEISKNDKIIAAQLVTTQLEPTDLLRMVANAFSLPSAKLSKSELLSTIEKFLRKQSEAGKRVLLIVDEAQNLELHSLEELRMLSNFQVGTKSLLQSFMLGQAEFRDTLRRPDLEQFRQRVIASYHLGPMDKNETRKYIEHRLKVAGWRNDPQFSNEAFSMIYDYSDGIPRRVNTLCDRLLLLSAMEKIHDIDENIVAQLVEELDEEIHFNKQAEETDSAGSQPGVSRASKPGLSGSTDTEARLRRLENIADKAQDLVKAILAKD
jgi:putative secretion ATPase (PEP-CTERM system associated)